MKLHRLAVLAITAALFSASASAALINLVPNGNFEEGNIKFYSDYNFYNGTNTTENQYTIGNNPSGNNSAWVNPGVAPDPSGIGGASALLFIGNGSPNTNDIVWASGSDSDAGPSAAPTAISINPGTQYFFEAYVANLCCIQSFLNQFPQTVSPTLSFRYQLRLNGVNVGSEVNLGDISFGGPVGTWQGASTNFNSGAANEVILYLRNAQSGAIGNDFAIDNIFLGEQTSQRVVPEPSSMALAAIGGVALVVARLRRK